MYSSNRPLEIECCGQTRLESVSLTNQFLDCRANWKIPVSVGKFRRVEFAVSQAHLKVELVEGGEKRSQRERRELLGWPLEAGYRYHIILLLSTSVCAFQGQRTSCYLTTMPLSHQGKLDCFPNSIWYLVQTQNFPVFSKNKNVFAGQFSKLPNATLGCFLLI